MTACTSKGDKFVICVLGRRLLHRGKLECENGASRFIDVRINWETMLIQNQRSMRSSLRWHSKLESICSKFGSSLHCLTSARAPHFYTKHSSYFVSSQFDISQSDWLAADLSITTISRSPSLSGSAARLPVYLSFFAMFAFLQANRGRLICTYRKGKHVPWHFFQS